MTPGNEVAIKALAAYLAAETGIKTLAHWPDPKEVLELPTISLIAPSPKYNHSQSVLIKKVLVSSAPDIYDAVYMTGQYDFIIQLDLWCEYKPQRAELIEKIEDAFNKAFSNDQNAVGLILPLEDYYDQLASYCQNGYTYPDSEELSQRSEWRAKLEVLVTHSRLQVKRQSLIVEIEIQHQISDTIEVEDPDDLDLQENIQV